MVVERSIKLLPDETTIQIIGGYRGSAMSWFEEKQGDDCTQDATPADNDEEIIALLNARGSRRRDDGKQRRLSTNDTERCEACRVDSHVQMAPSSLLLALCTYSICCREGTFKLGFHFERLLEHSSVDSKKGRHFGASVRTTTTVGVVVASLITVFLQGKEKDAWSLPQRPEDSAVSVRGKQV